MRRLACFVIGLLALTASIAPAQPVDKDAAVLEVHAPADAKIKIDGQPHTTPRLQEQLGAGAYAERKVQVEFADGTTVERQVLLRGGWHVRLALLPDVAQKFELVTQIGHTSGAIRAVAFSRDGKLALTGADDRTAAIWSTQTGQRLVSFQMHSLGVVYAAAFSPDDRYVLLGCSSNNATLWDTRSGKLVRTFSGHKGAVKAVAFSPDGGSIVTASNDHSAIVWNVQTGAIEATLKGHTKPLTGAFFSTNKNDRAIVTASEDGTLGLWVMPPNLPPQRVPIQAGGAQALALHPLGSRFATGADTTVLLWDLQANPQQPVARLEGHTAPIRAVAYSGDGKKLLSTSADGTARWWDADARQTLTILKDHTKPVVCGAVSPAGQFLLTGAEDNSALLWNADGTKVLRRFQGSTTEVWGLAIHPKGAKIAAGAQDGSLVIWDLQTGQASKRLGVHKDGVRSASWSSDGKQLASAGGDHKVHIWDAATGERLTSLEGHTDEVRDVVFFPDNTRVATCSKDASCAVWNILTGEKVATFREHSAEGAFRLTVSPDGKSVISSDNKKDGPTCVWNASNGQTSLTLQLDKIALHKPIISPDGQTLAVGAVDSHIVLFNPTTGARLRTLVPERNFLSVVGMAFTPDGKYLVTAHCGNMVLIWDMAEGKIIRKLQAHHSCAVATTFLPDGRHFFTSSRDGTVRLWDLATGDELARLISMDQGREWVVLTPDGLFDGSAVGQQKVSFRVGATLDVFPVDRFYQEYYRAGLLSVLLQGHRPRPGVTVGSSKAPLVKVITPTKAGATTEPRVTIEVEVTDQGGGIFGPRLFHNGTRLVSLDEPKVMSGALRQSFQVELIEGDNRIEIKAASKDRSWPSEPAQLLFQFGARLAKSDLYVLAVGIDDYPDDLKLKFAAADATAIGQVFHKRGQKLYDKVHLRTLLDGKATRQGILDAIDDIAKTARPQDSLLVFLSGNAALIGKDYYFLPHGVGIAAGMDTHLGKHGLGTQTLGEQMARIKALKRLLIVDACHSGKLSSALGVSRDPFAFRGAIEQLGKAEGVFMIAATATPAVEELPALGHGMLTYSLLAGLHAVKGGPLQGNLPQINDPEQVQDVLAWFSYAASQVRTLGQRYYQEPQNSAITSEGRSFPVLPVED